MWLRIVTTICFLTGSHCTRDTIERETKLGRVIGLELNVLNAKIEQYLGIPYAEPPLGARRFRASIPATPWNGTYDATSRRTACPQPGLFGLSPTGINYTEDCLRLNVWTRQREENETVKRFPIVVWIHGGGFKYSSSSNPKYNGSILCAKTGLVVVSMNYRLGVLGFLDANSVEAPGNMGLMDQMLALKWVQDNAEFFGGNPFKVTVFGQSAGSMSVHAHILSPLSKDLFQNAILLSGSLYSIDMFDSPSQSLQKGDRVSTIVNCSYEDWNLSTHADDVISCLRNKSVEELISASAEAVAPKFVPFFPTYHNDFLPKDPRTATERGFFNRVTVVLGLTSDEMCWALARSTRGRLLLEDIEAENATSIRQVMERTMEQQMRDVPPSTVDRYLDNVNSTSNTALVRQYLDYLSDRMFNCPVHFLARHLAARGNKVFSYVFAHKYHSPELPAWVGTPHTGELLFLFGHHLVNASHLRDEHHNISEAFVRILSSFASTGTPELPTGRQWPLYTESNPVSVVLAPGNYSDVHGFRAAECEFWKTFFEPRLVA